MTTAPALLEVKGLRVSFGGQEVVHGIDFSISAGEKLALVGESGSGKTVSALSLLRLVHNAEVSGAALLNGRDLLALTERQLRGVRGDDVAFVFQEPMSALNPLYTVGDQIREVLQLKKGLAPRQASAAAIELLASTGIPEPARRANAFPHQLSGGQRQRIVVARALMLKPRLIVADEPVSMIDASLRANVLENLRALRDEHGISIIYITHDLATARQVSNRLYVLYRGRAVEVGAAGDVIGDPRHPYTQLLMSSIPRPDPDAPWPAEHVRKGEIGTSDRAACVFLDRCPRRMPVCSAQPPDFALGDGRSVSCFLYADGRATTAVA